MLFAAIAAVLGSAIIAYVLGYAFVAPRGSLLRTKRGILVLVLAAGSLIPLPPQLIGLEASAGPLGGLLGTTTGLTWPGAIGKTAYVVIWLITTVFALLAGLRIWQLGTPEWRGGANKAFDASPASRATSLLPMADRIEEALETLGRAGLTTRDIPRVSADVREAGRRFADSLPPSDGEVYRLVVAHVPASVAGPITGLLLEGAERRRSST